MRTFYLDYNATTPLDGAVREAMVAFLEERSWGNPSSIHHVGRRARALLDEGRERVALVLSSRPSEVIFTSGGTESTNLALFGTARRLRPKGRHIVTSSIEHHAVLHSCAYLKREGFEVTYLPVDRQGIVAPDVLEEALRADTILVSIMAANNEIGTLQPVAELGAVCRKKGLLFHTDAVQWFGKQRFTNIDELNADLVSICAHKLHGPKGAGILYVRSPLHPDPILFGGGHENERRAGTENLPAIMGSVEAMERFVREPVFSREKLTPLTSRLRQLVEGLEGVQFVGSRSQGLANTTSFVVEGTDSIALLAGLDVEGICASSGSACSAGSLEPSHVVSALGLPDLAKALVRFSLGRESTLEEVAAVEAILPEVIRRARKFGNHGQ